MHINFFVFQLPIQLLILTNISVTMASHILMPTSAKMASPILIPTNVKTASHILTPTSGLLPPMRWLILTPTKKTQSESGSIVFKCGRERFL